MGIYKLKLVLQRLSSIIYEEPPTRKPESKQDDRADTKSKVWFRGKVITVFFLDTTKAAYTINSDTLRYP